MKIYDHRKKIRKMKIWLQIHSILIFAANWSRPWKKQYHEGSTLYALKPYKYADKDVSCR